MDFKAADIANFLNGEIVGDGNVKVSNVSKIEEGKPGMLAFLANQKYESHIYSTKASIVLVNKTFVPKHEIKATLIRVDDAYASFAALLEMVGQARTHALTGVEEPSFIDKTAKVEEDLYLGAFAYVGKNSRIGKRVKIHPQVHIGSNVTIGDDCTFMAGAKIYNDTVIGDRCTFYAGVVIGSDGFGFAPTKDGPFKKIPQIGNVIIEDDVEIGSNSTIDCGTMGSTIIHKGVKIDNLVQIGHNCVIGENTVIAAQSGMAGSAKIGKNCMVGGQVGIAGHISIGDNVVIGAQAGVIHPIKDNEKVWGTPAFNYRDALKAYVTLKSLPEMRKEIYELQKELKSNK